MNFVGFRVHSSDGFIARVFFDQGFVIVHYGGVGCFKTLNWLLHDSLYGFIGLFQSEQIKFYTMSILRPEDDSTHIEDIVFLYRYLFVDSAM